MQTQALINGNFYSHASYTARIHGFLVYVKEINWKHAVERAEVRQNSRKPLGFTIGEWKGEASLTVLRAVWDQIKAYCISAKGQKALDCQGDLVITYTERGQPTKTIQVKVAGLAEADTTTSQGTEATEVKLTVAVLDILEDGVSLINDEV